jgi:hypothetical protein
MEFSGCNDAERCLRGTNDDVLLDEILESTKVARLIPKRLPVKRVDLNLAAKFDGPIDVVVWAKAIRLGPKDFFNSFVGYGPLIETGHCQCYVPST